MNWHKYTLEGWLEQFGAWCDTAKHDEPDDLSENILYKLMVSTGYVKRNYRNKVVCEITDSEAMAVQNMLNDVLRRTTGDMKGDLEMLINHYVDGASFRDIAEKKGSQKDAVKLKVYGAKCFLKGRFSIYFT